MPDAPLPPAVDGRAPWWWALDRRRLAVAIGTTFLALPILVLDNLPTGPNSAEAVETRSGASAAPTTASTVVVTTTVPSSTTVPPTTTAPPPTAPTTTAPPTTAPPRRTTTTPAPPPPTTAPPTTVAAIQPVAPATTAPPAPAPPPAANEERGKATWYHWNPGECAHKTLPKGTTVTVTNLANGLSTTCLVTDRGPYGAGRIIDLDSTVFDDLAGLGTGVIDVVITW